MRQSAMRMLEINVKSEPTNIITHKKQNVHVHVQGWDTSIILINICTPILLLDQTKIVNLIFFPIVSPCLTKTEPLL